ncbi:DUF5420 family protein [Xenorhabdus sp. XENO-1]|uniref:DUF5420 family protein n=1 Tax=Xenorhabdus bovienii TaxID=40576 RepID=UPI0020CA4579|nr:DUF5420 family protein [Xenorhabdus bovienii]MCP9270340.1 DUF5420 family protein [Xenorhabdus bovienii subsp. africana]
MSEKDYKYYRLSGDIVNQLDSEYELIQENRQEVINQALDKIGAKGVSWDNSWGKNDSLISYFAFPIDKEFPVPVKIINSNSELKIIRAKANSKAGKEFNKKLDDLVKETNSQLKHLLSYKDFLINKFNIQCCTLGTPQPHHKRGVPMIETRAGKASKDNNILLFAIPNTKEHGDKQPEVPECFEEISYGIFYDLAN